jgi:MFS family permease
MRLFVVALGAAHTWVAIASQSMNPDGVDYLDIAESYLRGDWANAINAYWGPLYSWILGLALYVFEPSLRWEFTLVHIVNFLIYLFALGCFLFFWRELSSARDELHDVRGHKEGIRFSSPVWIVLGYLVFIWTSLYLIEIWAVTPDMLVSALVFLAAGLILRLATSTRERSWAHAIAFGLILGFGYLAKSAMFPMAFVFIAGAFLAAGSRRRRAGVLISLAVFLVIVSPFLTAISVSKGRFTFGEAGRISYMKHVQKVPFPHWRTEFTEATAQPVHPTRRIVDRPAVFEFATPIAGTYPPSYDPSYWYDGVSLEVSVQRQLEIVVASVRYYLDLFLRKQGPVFGIVLLLLLLTPGSVFRARSALALWTLVGISLAGLGMYGLVLVEGRYIGPFVAILWGVALAFVRVDSAPFSARILTLAAKAIVILALVGIVAFNFEGFRPVLGWDDNPWRIVPAPVEERAPPLRPVQFAEALQKLGLRAGDRIAYIGAGHDAFFARLARLKIIAEVPADQSDEFWNAAPAQREMILRALASTGATAIVAEEGPADAVPDGWQRIADSRHLLFPLTARTSP